MGPLLSHANIKAVLNNGFFVLKCTELAEDLKKMFGDDELTVRTGIKVTVYFEQSVIHVSYIHLTLPTNREV